MARRFLSIMRHSGTHLIKPVLKNTIGTSKGGKGPTLLTVGVPESRIIVCTRDPRNRIISAFRYKYFRAGAKPAPVDDVDDLLANYMVERQIIQFMRHWADKWMGIPYAYYMRFEDFLTEEGTILAVSGAASYDNLSVSEDDIRMVWRQFYNKGPTYTGRHSRWKDWFGDKSLAVWRESKGKQLLSKMGYT